MIAHDYINALFLLVYAPVERKMLAAATEVTQPAEETINKVPYLMSKREVEHYLSFLHQTVSVYDTENYMFRFDLIRALKKENLRTLRVEKLRDTVEAVCKYDADKIKRVGAKAVDSFFPMSAVFAGRCESSRRWRGRGKKNLTRGFLWLMRAQKNKNTIER